MSEPCFCVVDLEGRVLATRLTKRLAEEARDEMHADYPLIIAEAEMCNGVVTVTGAADFDLGKIDIDLSGLFV